MPPHPLGRLAPNLLSPLVQLDMLGLAAVTQAHRSEGRAGGGLEVPTPACKLHVSFQQRHLFAVGHLGVSSLGLSLYDLCHFSCNMQPSQSISCIPTLT